MDPAMNKAITDIGAQVDAASGPGGMDKPPDDMKMADEEASGSMDKPDAKAIYEEMMADPEKGPVLKEMEAIADGKEVIMAMMEKMHEPGEDMKASLGGRLDKFKASPPKGGIGVASLFKDPGVKAEKK